MSTEPAYVSLGQQAGSIDVRLSYKIVELFSEGLYASPNKAIEELVANSFDAGALRVHVLLSPNLHQQDATIVVIDDGQGMDVEGLKQHWLIGISRKRRLENRPRGRQQIGKFGIGKLATYVLADRLTHITKKDGKYFSTSMNYFTLDKRVEKEVEPKNPIKLTLRTLNDAQAKQAVAQWVDSQGYKAGGMPLFGKAAPASWTVAVMSTLKEKVHEIKPGVLEWVLRTALPLRPDFEIWLNEKKLSPSKQGKGLLKRWVLGKDLTDLPRPAPKDVTISEDGNAKLESEHRFGLDVPGLGRITGYAETYKDLLTGSKADEVGRSYGFFVFVFGRLVNVQDHHFGIAGNELRHGTFNRFRLVVHMDGLDASLRSNREAISDGPLLSTAQDVLRGVFNYARQFLEKMDDADEPGAQLSRKLAGSPASLSRRPIVDLARAALEGKATARGLLLPSNQSASARATLISELEQRADDAETFITGLTIDFDGSSESGMAQYEAATGLLRINAWHPFVATFHDEFASRRSGQPLELFAMAEVLLEAHLHSIGVKRPQIEEVLGARDLLLRTLANESGRKSAMSIAQELVDARNSPDGLEDKICAAFRSLGFDVTRMGKPKQPDGVALAHVSAGPGGSRRYSVSLEGKSKETHGHKVSAKTVGVSTVARQRDTFQCDHAIVVGPSFPTTQGEKSALAQEIKDDRDGSKAKGLRKTITLITVDDLAKLVRLRPTKQIGLIKLRELFECSLPEESAVWVKSIEALKLKRPPYRRIVETIEASQKKFNRAPVKYAALRVELSHLKPPIDYETDEELVELCKAMEQMAAGALFANAESVELDQSAENVLAAIDAATEEPAEKR